MRILSIAIEVPYPASSGARVHTYNIIRRLAKRHDVWFAGFKKATEGDAGIKHLEMFCEGVLTANFEEGRALEHPLKLVRRLTRGIPPDFRFYESEELRDKIRRLVCKQRFDIVHIENTEMALYLELMPEYLKDRTSWHLHDIDWLKFARIAKLEKKRKRKLRLWLHSFAVRRWIPHYAERFARCSTVSEEDRALLLKANPDLHVDVIPTGVDVEKNSLLSVKYEGPSLIFVGCMDYIPNIDAVLFFCKDILPLIKRKIPNVKLMIVGPNPVEEVKDLQSDHICVTGMVDDVRDYYAQSMVSILPIRGGGGTRLKLLEAMALGRPIVATTIALEGRDVVAGEHVLIADTAEDFAYQTVRLIVDHRLKERLISNGRTFVEEKYSYDSIVAKLEKIFAELMR